MTKLNAITHLLYQRDLGEPIRRKQVSLLIEIMYQNAFDTDEPRDFSSRETLGLLPGRV